MFQRLTFLSLTLLILGGALIACGGAADQPTAIPTTAEVVTAPTNTPVAPTVAAMPTEPSAPPVEATTPPTQAAPTAEAAEVGPAATTEPAIPPTLETAVRTFRLVPEQSEASYEVAEEFFNRPVKFFSPVGRTQSIEGEFELSLAGNQVALQENQFTVDLRTLASDESRRDQRIRDTWLESNKYPLAQFTAKSIQDFPANAVEGQDIPFKIVGDMTIREITQPLTFDVTARLDGNTFSGTATTNLLMKDYGFDPPEILGMLKVTDGVTVTVKFTAAEAEPAP